MIQMNEGTSLFAFELKLQRLNDIESVFTLSTQKPTRPLHAAAHQLLSISNEYCRPRSRGMLPKNQLLRCIIADRCLT